LPQKKKNTANKTGPFFQSAQLPPSLASRRAKASARERREPRANKKHAQGVTPMRAVYLYYAQLVYRTA